MNPTTVMIVCAVLIAAILLFILSQLPAKIRERRAEIAQRAPEQENKPAKGGTFKKFIYYIILGVILIGSGMGVSMLIVLMENTFSFRNPAPIIWGVAAGIMLLFKPLVRKLLKMDK